MELNMLALLRAEICHTAVQLLEIQRRIIQLSRAAYLCYSLPPRVVNERIKAWAMERKAMPNPSRLSYPLNVLSKQPRTYFLSLLRLGHLPNFKTPGRPL